MDVGSIVVFVTLEWKRREGGGMTNVAPTAQIFCVLSVRITRFEAKMQEQLQV